MQSETYRFETTGRVGACAVARRELAFAGIARIAGSLSRGGGSGDATVLSEGKTHKGESRKEESRQHCFWLNYDDVVSGQRKPVSSLLLEETRTGIEERGRGAKGVETSKERQKAN